MNAKTSLTHLAVALSCAACTAHAREAGDSTHAAAAVPRGTASPTQPPGDTTYVTTAEELRHINAELAGGTRTSGLFRDHPGIQVLETRRVENGGLEVHDDWMDATYVQAGHATLLSGGRLTGSSLRSPGEHRGGTLTGGSTRQLKEGDFLFVPAGVPHQVLVARGDSIRYVTIKVPRAKTP